MADWANLPTDILYLIANRADCMEDFLAISAVCKSWNLTTSVPALPPRFPWIMLPYESLEEPKNMPFSRLIQTAREINYEKSKTRRFYSLSTSKIHKFELAEAGGRKCLGTSYGWLVTISNDLQVNLQHPFSRQQISLPSLLTFQEQNPYDYKLVEKVVLSRNPWNIDRRDDCIAVAICGDRGRLVFARLGDQAWTNIKSFCIDDIMYWNGSFYAVNEWGALFICEIDSEQHGPRTTRIAKGPCWPNQYFKNYVTESSGDILLIFQIKDYLLKDGFEITTTTTGFSIFRLEKSNEDVADHPYVWTKVEDLGDRSLFLGKNASVSLPSSDCVKANCIYFSEDCNVPQNVLEGRGRRGRRGRGRYTGIFHVEKNYIEWHCVAKFCSPLSPLVWYI